MMRLKRLGNLRPPALDPRGTFAGWFLPPTSLLAEATSELLRVWDIERRTLLNCLDPQENSLGRPNGSMAVFPHSRRVITVHENRIEPFHRHSVVLWHLPEFRPVVQRTGHCAVDPGISMGAGQKHFVTFSAQEASGGTPGLIVWDLNFEILARWKESPTGEPLVMEERGWVADSRCRLGESGVEIRAYDGQAVRTIASDAPITHQLRYRDGKLWLFQESGLLDLWDLDQMVRVGQVDLGHTDSMRADFPKGTVVCMDDVDESTVASLGADGTLKFWRLPDWECVLERPFEMTPIWIDVDPGRRLVAVGFISDEIELYSIT